MKIKKEAKVYFDGERKRFRSKRSPHPFHRDA